MKTTGQNQGRRSAVTTREAILHSRVTKEADLRCCAVDFVGAGAQSADLENVPQSVWSPNDPRIVRRTRCHAREYSFEAWMSRDWSHRLYRTNLDRDLGTSAWDSSLWLARVLSRPPHKVALHIDRLRQAQTGSWSEAVLSRCMHETCESYSSYDALRVSLGSRSSTPPNRVDSHMRIAC